LSILKKQKYFRKLRSERENKKRKPTHKLGIKDSNSFCPSKVEFYKLELKLLKERIKEG
jgi:hypothetical protein